MTAAMAAKDRQDDVGVSLYVTKRDENKEKHKSVACLRVRVCVGGL